jgi:hypothetical protein
MKKYIVLTLTLFTSLTILSADGDGASAPELIIDRAIKDVLELKSHTPQEDESPMTMQELYKNIKSSGLNYTVLLSFPITKTLSTIQNIRDCNLNTNIHEAIRAQYAQLRYLSSLTLFKTDPSNHTKALLLIGAMQWVENKPSAFIQARLDLHESSVARTTSLVNPETLLLERPFGVDMAREIIIGVDDRELYRREGPFFTDEWNSSRRS